MSDFSNTCIIFIKLITSFLKETSQRFRHPTRLVGKESSCVLFCLIRKTWGCSAQSVQGAFHASFLWSNKFPLLKLRHMRGSPCSKLKNKYSHTNWMNLMRFILFQEPVINRGLEKNKMHAKSEGGEKTFWQKKLLWEWWLMGVSLDPAEQLQGTRNLEDGSKKRKRPRWRKNKGKIQGTNELLKPFQESLEQHCIEAEFIGCCASPWGLLYPSCTVSKINTTSSKVTQTPCLQDRKKTDYIFKELWVRCQDNPLNQKQIFRIKVWHHPKLLPLSSNADGWHPIMLHEWN